MKTLTLRFPRGSLSSEIIIGKSLLARVPGILQKKDISKDYILLTDRQVEKLYGTSLKKSLSGKKLKCHLISIPTGEKSKSRKVKEKIENLMLQEGHGRDAILIALGGGVIGDLGGFVAATYLRGIPFIQMPTTLLSMADSSVGGKTAINHPLGKNLIGSFYQPMAIFVDIETLGTLPFREFKAGLAEVTKYGIILDEAFFSFIEVNRNFIINMDFSILEKIVEKCLRFKGRIVKKDEKEKGLRKILNYGHTIGHSIEYLSSYKIRHGEAVSIGMVVESYMSYLLGHLDKTSLERIIHLLQSFRLPVRIPGNLKAKEILKIAQLDKKSYMGEIRYVLPGKIGGLIDEREIAIPVEKKIVFQALERCC